MRIPDFPRAEISYDQFIRSKVRLADEDGIVIEPGAVHPALKPHQSLIVQWAIRGGCRAIFAAFGLGKTLIQLEIARLILQAIGGRALIIIPLGVRQEFERDAGLIGVNVTFIRRIEDADETGIYLTNYETVRDGKLDPTRFVVVSLDEAAVLTAFGGSKTFREFMRMMAGDGKTMNKRTITKGVQYRFVATATPSPNEYIELLAYAAYLGIMDVSAGKTKFFKRDSTKADKLTLHAHKTREFWMWCASWAIFVQKPSDLGCSDEGYTLPPIDIRWHEVASDHSTAGHEAWGQGKMFRSAAIGVVHAAREKRDSLPLRMQKLMELRAEDPSAHRVIWHDLERERDAIEKAIPGITAVYGKQLDEDKLASIVGFAEGVIPELAAKAVMLGAGVNFQKHCAWAIYLGIGFKFRDFFQSLHRLHRFLQTRPVRIDLIYTESERSVRQILETKWQQHIEMVAKMSEIIREYGLSAAAMAQHLTRAIDVERIEVTGRNYTIVNNDCVKETARMEENSVGLILTSVPFSTQYEYSPSYLDFGHTDNNAQFFEQMDYLTPNLLRVLQPGRIAAVHVKDRIVPGGLTGLGFQTVYPFHCKTIEHYVRHGFAYIGMKTIVTDVVRENNQTYRLGWSEQCKDGTKMGVGMPEYLLLFRKPPTDTTNSYADVPVRKFKPLCLDGDGNQVPFDRNLPIIPNSGYSRSRWQVDAHGFTRSSGQRLLTPGELRALPHDVIFKLFRDYSLSDVYDFEHHVRIGELLEAEGKLPVTFMLLQPQSWSPEVWTDITRMLTLNGAQSAAGREMHLCPMQEDLAKRAITQWSHAGDVVFDPFAGIGTVPYHAVKMGRKGYGVELSAGYFADAAMYCAMAEREMATPGLFDAVPEPIAAIAA